MSLKQFDMTSKFSERNVLKTFRHLVGEFEPYLPADVTRKLNLLLRNRDIDGIVSLGKSLGPQSIIHDYQGISPWLFQGLYQVGSLLKKYQFSGDQQKRRDTALAGFLESESRCRHFNSSGYRDLAFSDSENINSVFTYARGFISRILGEDLPSDEVLFSGARHGPGSTYISARGKVTTYYKYSTWPYTVTETALPYAIDLLESDARWLGALQDSYRERFKIPKHFPIDRDLFLSEVFTIVEGNRICFVPKDASKDRPIAIEPTINLMLQLGVDEFIRTRLRRWGIDLNDQSKNQRLASFGSTEWNLFRSVATLDLSAASDSVALKLCELLLPPSWYNYLLDIRSPQGEVEGLEEPIVYEKISSMGNGYTFALESLIFSALAYASLRTHGHKWSKENVAVFGDDIIVPSHNALFLVEVLQRSGFTLNLDKSFVFGDFRESCGTDWFKGTDVRPVFFDEPVEYVDDLYHYRNSLFVFMNNWFYHGYESKTVNYLDSLVPEHHRRFGPIVSNTNTHLFSWKPRYHHGNFEFQALVRQPRIWRPKDFLFRKLMHDLRPRVTKPFYLKDRVLSTSSRFEVTRRDAFDFAIQPSRCPQWVPSHPKLTR